MPPAAPCNTISGVTVTCTGNLSAGVEMPYASFLPSPSPYHVLNVQNVTGDITPAAGVDGIDFYRRTGDVTVNVDLSRPGGTGTISTALGGSSRTDGIYAKSYVYSDGVAGGPRFGDNATVSSIANIISHEGAAIYARALKDVTVDSTGELAAASSGIRVRTYGAVIVNNDGNISPATSTRYTQAGMFGIQAEGGTSIAVHSTGNIDAGGGILVNTWSPSGVAGPVTIYSRGNITAISDRGIGAGPGTGSSSIVSIGNITSSGDAIGTSGGNMAVTSTGNLLSTAGDGIYASGGAITVISNKDHGSYAVVGKTSGIYAKGGGGVTIESTGNVTATDGTAIIGGSRYTFLGDDVRITSTGGTLSGKTGGITANSASAAITINNSSYVTSQTGSGIKAEQSLGSPVLGGNVNLSSSGSINAFRYGVQVVSKGVTSVTTTGSSITTTNGSAITVAAVGWSDHPSAVVTNTSHLTAGGGFGSGIKAYANGSLTVDNSGAITAGATGIRAESTTASTTLTNRSAIVANDFGIRAISAGRTVITNSAEVSANRFTAVQGVGSTVAVSQTGDVSSTGGYGVYVRSFGANTSEVTSVTTGNVLSPGSIQARYAGIRVNEQQSGQVQITNADHIRAGFGAVGIERYKGDGISVTTSSGGASIANSGEIESGIANGIEISGGDGDLTISNTGQITTEWAGFAAGRGIVANSAGGNQTITNAGDIVGTGMAGISAKSVLGDIDIANSGNISAAFGVARYGAGISAETGNSSSGSDIGNITVTNTGSIQGAFHGINVRNTASGHTTINNGTAQQASQITVGRAGIYGIVEGDLDITNHSAIDANVGMRIRMQGGHSSNATIDNTGSLTGGYGIFVEGSGNLDIVNTGLVHVSYSGITGFSGGDVNISNSREIIAGTGNGLYASSAEAATVDNSADITAGHIGVRVGGVQSAFVSSTGNILAGSYGMVAVGGSAGGAVDVLAGSAAHPVTITAGWAGIYAHSWLGADVNVTSFADIEAGSAIPGPHSYTYFWRGIYARTNGGNVTVNSTGNVSTVAAGAAGIYARAFDTGLPYGAQTGAVVVNSQGTVSSSAVGIVGFSAADSVTIDASGSVTSASEAAILAGSQSGNIAITTRGLTLGATGSAAVQMGFTFEEYAYAPPPVGGYLFYTVLDGANNRLTITSTGDVRNAGGIDQMAIAGRSGNETVTNAGIVTGNVDLGSGANSFNNQSHALFNMGSVVSLGAGNALSNFGNLTIGGAGAVMQTQLTGNLNLGASSIIGYDLGFADTVGGPLNDLLSISGDLTLDGYVSVAQSPGGNFTKGVYRLMNYGGSLVDNGLSILGPLPNGLSGTIQTAIAGQVNLIFLDSPTIDIAYWDGPHVTPGDIPGGRGGTAIWNSPTNWTTAPGNANSVWDSGVAVFGGTNGTVTVEGTQNFVGLQFVTDDYLLQAGSGGALNLGTGGFVYVDSGLNNTEMAVGVGGEGALLKQGDGRLVLSGTNLHQGGTVIQAGTLAAGSDAALGSGGGFIANGATLQAAAASVQLANDIGIDQAGTVSTIDTQGYSLALSGSLSGAGKARKVGAGTLELDATDSAIGGLELAAGNLTNKGILGVVGLGQMGTDTLLTNASGAQLGVFGGIIAGDGVQTIDNAGLLLATIDLGGGRDAYRLHASGWQLGAVDGGAGEDSLALSAGPDGRWIEEGDYVNFERLTLNGEPGDAGLFVLDAAASASSRATLDLGAEGTATLAAGELKLAYTNSSLRAGHVTTASGSELSGNGTVFGDLAMGGVITPGNDSMGVLTVEGDYQQTGDYEVEISHYAGGAPGVALSDRIVTSGAVSFGGTVHVAAATASSLEQIMSAAAAQGAMRWRILDGTSSIAPEQRTAALDVPEGFAAALDYANGGQDVDLFLAWAAPPDMPEQAGLLWQTALEPEMALCDVTEMQAGKSSCAFLQGASLSIEDDASDAGNVTAWSGVAGGGGAVQPNLWLGLGAGYGGGDMGSGDYDQFSAYLWGRWTPGRAELRGFAGLDHYAVDGRRQTTSGDTASWDYGAWQPYLAAEGRYWMDLSQTLAITPVAGLTSVWLRLPGQEETGAGIENFQSDQQTLWGLTTLLGGEARWQATPTLAFEASAGWQHLFGDDKVTISGTYASSPGTELARSSDAVGRDAAALGIGVLLDVTENSILHLAYDAELSDDELSQSANARLTISW